MNSERITAMNSFCPNEIEPQGFFNISIMNPSYHKVGSHTK